MLRGWGYVGIVRFSVDPPRLVYLATYSCPSSVRKKPFGSSLSNRYSFLTLSERYSSLTNRSGARGAKSALSQFAGRAVNQSSSPKNHCAAPGERAIFALRALPKRSSSVGRGGFQRNYFGRPGTVFLGPEGWRATASDGAAAADRLDFEQCWHAGKRDRRTPP